MTTCTCGQPTAGAWLCDNCQTTFKWALVNVGAYAGDLENVARKQTRYGAGGKGGIGKSQPLVLDGRFTGNLDHGSQLRNDTRATVVAWAKTIQEDQPEVAGPTCSTCIHVSCAAINRRRWPADNISAMIRYFARQFRWLVAEQWSPAMFDEMLDLERRLSWFVDRPADKWYAGRCGVTDELIDGTTVTCETELYATADKGTIVCPGCGITHDVAERRTVLLREAKEYHVTASEAAAALMAWTDYDGTTKKLIDLITYWRTNDALEDHGVTEISGQWRKVYRLGDVQDRLIEHAQREQNRRLTTKQAS